MVLVGGIESYLLVDMLVDYEVLVIVGLIYGLFNIFDSDVDQVFKMLVMLYEAGVDFCLSNDGFWQ